ncbi:hypothetical protein C6361_00295 [Plantactinospora sp. BC1]|uniref:class I SAM-dependent methyltransferase n=1 Tax=Plantactinospora sp. BC1 TaxID=2108470 RepID=UPI000D1611C1|nr:class I SAM-dependent methyltransferase [Plantactinospora sp. BC1]AVT28194.1 hypothetical protein C6361_00295 [Plantactinospora sp. BC1]
MTNQAQPGLDRQHQEPSAGPLIEHARRACLMHRLSFEGTDPHSVRVPADAVEELVQSLTIGETRRRVQQIIPFMPDTRRQFSGMIWRQLAQRCEVERYYLVPSGDERRALEVVQRDEESQLTSLCVSVQGWSEQPQVPMADLWLIDGCVVVREEFGGSGSASWLVSGHTSEIENARRMLRSLAEAHRMERHLADGGRPTGPDLTRWMLESAQMLYALASMSCTSSKYVDPEECRWYHGVWQYLRLFDMVSSPSWHASFYADRLREEIQNGARRILISGTADYTTLAFVLHAARDSSGVIPPDLDVHVLDLCQTPLLACQWYAGRLGLRITLHKADVTSSAELSEAGLLAEAPFDLIVADAFLTRLSRKQARQAVDNWSGLLRSRGTVLTTVRLHPRNDYRIQEPSDLEANDRYRVTDPTDDFELRLRERASGWQGMLSIDIEDLSRAGRRYAERMKSHDLGDVDEVIKLFQDRDFDVLNRTAERVQGELVGTEYLRVTASRQ